MYFDKKLSDIQWCQEDKDTHVSEMLLMKSPAGWYFGRICEVIHEFDDDIMKSTRTMGPCIRILIIQRSSKSKSILLI